MAERRVWIGSVGPLLYDDEDVYTEETDPSSDPIRGLRVDGGIILDSTFIGDDQIDRILFSYIDGNGDYQIFGGIHGLESSAAGRQIYLGQSSTELGIPGADSIVSSAPFVMAEGKYFIFSHFSTGERDALTPGESMVIYNEDMQTLQLYNGSSWVDIEDSSGGHPVDSVFGRTGHVSAQSGDYDFSQIGGIVDNAQLDPTRTANTLILNNNEASDIDLPREMGLDESDGLLVRFAGNGAYPSGGVYRVLDNGNTRFHRGLALTGLGAANPLNIGLAMENVTIEDDDFTQIGSINTGTDVMTFVFLGIRTVMAIYPIWPTTAPGPALAAASVFDNQLGVPTGTTGSDGNVTLFYDDSNGDIYVENRAGGISVFTYIIIEH